MPAQKFCGLSIAEGFAILADVQCMCTPFVFSYICPKHLRFFEGTFCNTEGIVLVRLPDNLLQVSLCSMGSAERSGASVVLGSGKQLTFLAG